MMKMMLKSGDDNDEMDKHQPNVSLIVAVAKGKGPHLEFCCTAYPNEITIDRMLIKGNEVSADKIAYEGLEFSDLDEDLQKAFYKYLEVRGIKSSLTNSLQQYMVSKDNREYLSHNFRMVPDSMIEASEMRSRELLVYHHHHQCNNCIQARQSNIKACPAGPIGLCIKQMKMSMWNGMKFGRNSDTLLYVKNDVSNEYLRPPN
ncbi:MAM33, mitochondrial matrix glycoprotein [Cinnamomum micranthum f. kanehirae]|uniref:MAM33, mitochondrial matrix glycoprotein n=1 Tax=Cinnamomum micranthum f. kanehirae TaxID=337451 RepID=A0A3S3Q2W5_9MAGN|nr:MAM33, mitochondrial matrix glycoprotein [Cinnamomum micranthum f. kanehirae]